MPITDEGKTIAARNATTHGLFARDIVLPHLGEDPSGFEELRRDLSQQLMPVNQMEHHYVEKIAAASWRLRRLHRWQAQLWEDESLTEDQRLDKLDRTLRQETALHRQIDTSVKMLGRDVPDLFEGRARKQALSELGQTERDCKKDADINYEVAQRARQLLQFAPLGSDFDRARLDNGHARLICRSAAGPAPQSALSPTPLPLGEGRKAPQPPITGEFGPAPSAESLRGMPLNREEMIRLEVAVETMGAAEGALLTQMHAQGRFDELAHFLWLTYPAQREWLAARLPEPGPGPESSRGPT